jgi:hypothetical protein
VAANSSLQTASITFTTRRHENGGAHNGLKRQNPQKFIPPQRCKVVQLIKQEGNSKKTPSYAR